MQAVAAPVRKPQRGTLSDVADFQVDARVGASEDITFEQAPCAVLAKATRGLCWEDAPDDKTSEGPVWNDAIAAPFALYQGTECYLSSEAESEYSADALQALEQTQDAALALKVAAWAEGGANAGAGATLVASLAEVSDHLRENYVGEGIILASPYDINLLFAAGALEYDASGIPRTALDQPVLPVVGQDRSRISAVGAVGVRHSAGKAIAATDHETNTTLAIAERVYVIVVDCTYRSTSTVTP